MNKYDIIGMTLGAFVIGILGLAFEAWLLGLILSWFNVILSFWQNVCIVVLANLIFNSPKSST